MKELLHMHFSVCILLLPHRPPLQDTHILQWPPGKFCWFPVLALKANLLLAVLGCASQGPGSPAVSPGSWEECQHGADAAISLSVYNVSNHMGLCSEDIVSFFSIEIIAQPVRKVFALLEKREHPLRWSRRACSLWVSQKWDEMSHHLHLVALQNCLWLSCSISWLQEKWETRLQPCHESVSGVSLGGTVHGVAQLFYPNLSPLAKHSASHFHWLSLPWHPHPGMMSKGEPKPLMAMGWEDQSTGMAEMKFSVEEVATRNESVWLVGLRGQGLTTGSGICHWYLVSSGKTEGGTSQTKSAPGNKGPFSAGGAESAAWESRWAALAFWASVSLLLNWCSTFWETCLLFHKEISWGCSCGISESRSAG